MVKRVLLSLAAAAFIFGATAALQPDTAQATFFGDRAAGSSWHDGWRQKWADKMARKCAWYARMGWHKAKCAQYAAPAQYAPPYRPMK